MLYKYIITDYSYILLFPKGKYHNIKIDKINLVSAVHQ